MASIRSLCLAALLFQTTYAQTSLNSVSQAFTDAKIVPDVIPTFRPSALLNISFIDESAGKEFIISEPGVRYSKQQTSLEPEYYLYLNNTVAPPSSNSSTPSNSTSPSNSTTSSNSTTTAPVGTYVLALIDADAPTIVANEKALAVQFLGGGFTVNSESFLSSSTKALVGYTAPDPLSDPHRYVYLVWNQSPAFDANATSLVNSTTIKEFDLTQFTTAMNLGSPIAGNYFLVGGSAPVTRTSSTRTIPTASVALTPLAGSATGRHTAGLEMLAAFSMATILVLLLA